MHARWLPWIISGSLSLGMAGIASVSAERVSMTTSSGARLTADYRDAGPNAPGVLFFPMCRADAAEGWAPVAERLRAAGVSSLIVRYRDYEGNATPVAGDQREPDADAALAFLLARLPADRGVAVAGSSCGVWRALTTAVRHPDRMRAVVAFTGPHTRAHAAHIATSPNLAVLSGSGAEDHPAPDWARELRTASAHPASRLLLPPGKAHGTDAFQHAPAVADEIATWLAERLRPTPSK
jgi:dienelactone hydrolase